MSFSLEQWTAPKQSKRKTGEGAVLDDVSSFLESRGWLVIRFETGLFLGYGTIRQFVDTVVALVKEDFDRPPTMATKIALWWKKIRPMRIGTTTLGWKGFPDLIAIRHNRRPGAAEDATTADVLFIECKREGNKPDPEQRMLLDKLRRGYRFRALYTDGLDSGKQPFRDYYKRRVEPFLPN